MKCSENLNRSYFPEMSGWGKTAYGAIALVGLAFVLLLAACSDDSQNAGDLSQGGIQRLSRAAGQVDGTVLLLAKELVASNVNPFLSKLPITADAQAEAEPPPPIDGKNQADAQPPADPFEGVALLGISYQPKNAYALVSVSGGAAQVVREGDLLTTESGSQIKIGKIQQAQIEAAETGSGSSRSLTLPDIIGYTQTAGGDGSGNGGGGEGRGRGSRGGRGKPMGEKSPSSQATQDVTVAPDGKAPIIKLED